MMTKESLAQKIKSNIESKMRKDGVGEDKIKIDTEYLEAIAGAIIEEIKENGRVYFEDVSTIKDSFDKNCSGKLAGGIIE